MTITSLLHEKGQRSNKAVNFQKHGKELLAYFLLEKQASMSDDIFLDINTQSQLPRQTVKTKR